MVVVLPRPPMENCRPFRAEPIGSEMLAPRSLQFGAQLSRRFPFVLRLALAKLFSCCERGLGVYVSTVEFTPTLRVGFGRWFCLRFLCGFLRLFSRGLLGALVVALVAGFCLSAFGLRLVWRGRCSFPCVRRFKVIACVAFGAGAASLSRRSVIQRRFVSFFRVVLSCSFVLFCRCFRWRGRCLFRHVRQFKLSRLWPKVSSVQTPAVATHQRQHNKALHPTAYSLRFGRSSRRFGFRRRVSLVVSPLRDMLLSPRAGNAPKLAQFYT